MCSQGKPVIGPTIIEKANIFYDQIKMTDKCMFSLGSNTTDVRNFISNGTSW
jgi:hypothetical protein